MYEVIATCIESATMLRANNTCGKVASVKASLAIH